MTERKYTTREPETIENLCAVGAAGESVEMGAIGDLPAGRYLVKGWEHENGRDYTFALQPLEAPVLPKRKYTTVRVQGPLVAAMQLAMETGRAVPASEIPGLAAAGHVGYWQVVGVSAPSPAGSALTLERCDPPALTPPDVSKLQPLPVAPPPPQSEPTLSDLMRELQGARCEIVELRAKVDGLRRELLAHGAPLRVEVGGRV